jgi:hypothetical protein
MKKKPKFTVEQTTVEVEGQKIPAKIYREMRRNVRFSIARKGAILRMPLHLPMPEQTQEVARFRNWVNQQISGKDALKEIFYARNYQSGDRLKVGNKSYQLQVEMTEAKTHTAKLSRGVVYLFLTKNDTDAHRNKAVKHLLSRLIANDFYPEIERRVAELNHLYFRETITSVNLKYNLSNWGSCSSKGNLNFSTRLLFAPGDVIDYVIIHELAHLLEMNHSDRFWLLVEKAMPDYQEKELWLKKNWRICDF